MKCPMMYGIGTIENDITICDVVPYVKNVYCGEFADEKYIAEETVAVLYFSYTLNQLLKGQENLDLVQDQDSGFLYTQDYYYFDGKEYQDYPIANVNGNYYYILHITMDTPEQHEDLQHYATNETRIRYCYNHNLLSPEIPVEVKAQICEILRKYFGIKMTNYPNTAFIHSIDSNDYVTTQNLLDFLHELEDLEFIENHKSQCYDIKGVYKTDYLCERAIKELIIPEIINRIKED